MQTQIVKAIKRHIKMLFTQDANPAPMTAKLAITDSYCTSKTYSDIMQYVTKLSQEVLLRKDYYTKCVTTWTVVDYDDDRITMYVQYITTDNSFGNDKVVSRQLEITLNTWLPTVTHKAITNVNSVIYSVEVSTCLK